MWTTLGQYIGARVVTAVLVVASVAVGIWFWNHPEQLENLWLVVRRGLLWLGLVLVLPWASYFATGWVVRRDTNASAAALLGGLTLVDAGFAFYLSSWQVTGVLTWMVLILGILCAAVYNFLVCDFQAERFSDAF